MPGISTVCSVPGWADGSKNGLPWRSFYRTRTSETVEAQQFICSPAVELDILAWADACGVKIIFEHDCTDLSQLRIPMTGRSEIPGTGSSGAARGVSDAEGLV